MTVTAALTSPVAAAEDDFPEVEIAVTSVTDRARATFAKTHNRPCSPSFAETLGSSK